MMPIVVLGLHEKLAVEVAEMASGFIWREHSHKEMLNEAGEHRHVAWGRSTAHWKSFRLWRSLRNNKASITWPTLKRKFEQASLLFECTVKSSGVFGVVARDHEKLENQPRTWQNFKLIVEDLLDLVTMLVISLAILLRLLYASFFVVMFLWFTYDALNWFRYEKHANNTEVVSFNWHPLFMSFAVLVCMSEGADC